MSTYLDLVNLVIRESGKEQNELTSANFNSVEAGRRLYPRIKRYVADAWTKLQMSRNEWEFNNKEITVLLYPRFLIDGIVFSPPSTGPEIGSRYKGRLSGLELTVVDMIQGPETDEWYLDFTADAGWGRAQIGEIYDELAPNAGDSSFVYRGRGAYPIRHLDPLMREPNFSTFVSYQDTNTSPIPVFYIPWENWFYKEISYTQSTRSPPNFLSQDYKGDLTFYPQTLSPFFVNFVYPTAPQKLVEWDDVPVPELLPEEYHEWIAWEAMQNLARWDKDPDLMGYAQNEASFLKNRAERTLMPVVSWQGSRYNNGWRR